MPLFISDEEFNRYSGDATLIAEKADSFIRDLLLQLESAKAKSDASSITAEQTCSFLEQKYISLSSDFSNLQAENRSLSSAVEKRASELAEAQAEKHQVHRKAIEKDGELERLSVEVSELHKSKRQLLEQLEQKDSLIKSYYDKIVKLSEEITLKEAKLGDTEAELARCRAACARLSQEKELTEKHNIWLNDELTAKVNNLIEVRKSHAEFETEMSAKLSDVEVQFNECSSSLNWYKERVHELENKLTSVQEELCSTKDAVATNEARFSAEVATVSKLADLYKESAEDWSKKAGDLEGVIKALETHLSQMENDYQGKLEKEVCVRKHVEKEAQELKAKLETCELEIENFRKANEKWLVPVSSFENASSATYSLDGANVNDDASEKDDGLLLVPKVPSGVSATALAASLLRDGWSLVKMYEKYQEAADTLRQETWSRKQAEAVLKRVVCEIEEKAEIILDERAEHERMVEAYKLVDKKLQQSRIEHAKFERTIGELKSDLRKHERDYDLAQKEIADLQKQVTVLLKECRDIQIRCGGASVVGAEDVLSGDASVITDNGEMEKIISERLLTYKDINGLVEQNLQLRCLVRSLSDQRDQRDAELREKFEDELQKHHDEAAQKAAVLLQRMEEQGHVVETLRHSVAMYKRLYEEEHKVRSSKWLSGVEMPVDGRKDLMLAFEGSLEAAKKAREQAVERAKNLEEELDNLRDEVMSLRLERDKLIMEAKFSRERLEKFMMEAEHQRKECIGFRARSVEFSKLIVDYQKKLRDSADSLSALGELSRKLSMEISILKHEKDILEASEKSAVDEARNLTERVHRLQASLDTIQSAADAREEARALERRKREEYVKQIEREWAESKKELQEERDRVRSLKHDNEQTLKDAKRQVEQLGKELADALRAVTAAEARASAAEARYTNFEASIRSSERKIVDVNGGTDLSVYYSNELTAELLKANEKLEEMKKEAQANKEHMLQYKELAQVNEVALKQIESAHESFKAEADRLKNSLEEEIVSLQKKVSELESDIKSKTTEVSTATLEKEENLSIALSEINCLKEENSKKISQIMELEMQISSLREELEEEHQRWRIAQDNYERQVILQSETIQELAKTSRALSTLQDENSELKKLADARKSEIDVLKATWEMKKAFFEKLKHEAEMKYKELDEQNKILHGQLEALHKKLDDVGIFSASSDQAVRGGDDLQTVISYLRRSKEIAETEVLLLKNENQRLKSQLENSLKASDNAQALLHTELAKSQKTLFSDEEFKSLKLQVNELNLLRESNVQLREESKHNFEECQRLHETAQKLRSEAEHLNSLLTDKEVELESSRKEAEMLNAERSKLENRISELLERTKGINVEDYDQLKGGYQNMQVKLGEWKAKTEEFKMLANKKEEVIVKLQEDLASNQSKLLDIEKRLNETLQAEAVLKSEAEKHKRVLNLLKKKEYTLAKEKEEAINDKQTLTNKLEDLRNEKLVLFNKMEDVVKGNESLTKQIEDLRSSKKNTVDTSSEQAIKEKDTRIQILEKTLEREKSRRVKSEQIVLFKVTQVQQERDKLMIELEKHKLAKDSHEQTSGTSGTVLPVDIGLNEQATTFMSAVDDLERAAQSAFSDATGASSDDSAAGVAGHEVQNPLNENPEAVAAAECLQAKPIDEREKRALVPKPSTETRKMGRRLVRPHLERTQELRNDVETPEVEGHTVVEGPNTVKETKPGSSHEPGPYSVPSTSVHVPSRRKRQTSTTISDFVEGTPEQESIDGAPDAKKTKGLDGSSEGAFMEEQSTIQSSEISKMSLPVIESGEDTVDLVLPSNEIANAAKVEVMEGPTDMVEDVIDPLAGSHQGDLENESLSVVEELLVEQPREAVSPDGDANGVDVLDPQHSVMEVEGDKEEGELVFEATQPREVGDILSSLSDTEAGNSQVELLAEDPTVELLPPDVLIEKNVNTEATEKADEGTDTSAGDKPGDNNDSAVLDSSQQSPQVSFGGGEGSSSTAASASAALKQSIPTSPVKEEMEERENPPAGRIVNLAERARQNAALRRDRGRGRASTLPKRGARGRGRRGG